MDILLEFVKALAWPVTVVLLGFLFRRELRGVIRRLSHVKYKEWEARFEKDLREAEENAKRIPVPVERPAEISEPSEYDRIVRLVEVSPRAAVTEAWREVEVATARAVQAAGLNVEARIAGTRRIHQLVQRELIPESIVPVYTQLRHLRNQAAHAVDFEIEASEAERFADLALGIATRLNEIAERLA